MENPAGLAHRCGLVALITFWMAAFARKGAPWHLRVGKAYMIAMLGIVATAAPMVVIIGMQGKPGIATFLAYLVVITSTGMWMGWRAVKRKRDQPSFRGGAYLWVALLNLAASAVVFAVGMKMSQTLLMGFSAPNDGQVRVLGSACAACPCVCVYA